MMATIDQDTSYKLQERLYGQSHGGYTRFSTKLKLFSSQRPLVTDLVLNWQLTSLASEVSHKKQF